MYCGIWFYQFCVACCAWAVHYVSLMFCEFSSVIVWCIVGFDLVRLVSAYLFPVCSCGFVLRNIWCFVVASLLVVIWSF